VVANIFIVINVHFYMH